VTRIELQLRQRDLDHLGHMNQAVYHELLEEVRTAFFRDRLPDLPSSGFVLARVEADYKREVRIDHRYLVGEARATDIGRSRLELENRLLLPDGEVALEGRVVLVAWDGKARKARKSRPWTEDERTALMSDG
jgi:acyl-CoA thioester hydrolase